MARSRFFEANGGPSEVLDTLDKKPCTKVCKASGVELTNGVVDPLQAQAVARRTSSFLEIENASRFREIEPSPVSETVSEIETPEE